MALVAYQFVVACYYVAAVWRRTLYASANAYDDFRHGRQAFAVRAAVGVGAAGASAGRARSRRGGCGRA